MGTTTVGILGLGRMGEAVAQALLADPELETLRVTPRSAERVARLCEVDARVDTGAPQDILHSCDTVVVALGPGPARDLLGSLSFEPRHQVISVMAEIGFTELSSLTAGAASASRLLTLPSVARGGQSLPVFPATGAVERWFGRHNSLIVADSERELLAFWSITGLLSSVLTVGRVAARWLEDAGIDARRAEAYARTLFPEVHGLTASGFEHGLEHVSTPGGLNVMMRQRLQEAGLERQIGDGLDVISERLLQHLSRDT